MQTKPKLSMLLWLAMENQWQLPDTGGDEDVAPYQSIVDCMRKGEFDQAWRKARSLNSEFRGPGAVDAMLLMLCSDLVKQYWRERDQSADRSVYFQIMRRLEEHGC